MTLLVPVLLGEVLKDSNIPGPFSSATVGMATEPGQHTRVIEQRGLEYQIATRDLSSSLSPLQELEGCARLSSSSKHGVTEGGHRKDQICITVFIFRKQVNDE